MVHDHLVGVAVQKTESSGHVDGNAQPCLPAEGRLATRLVEKALKAAVDQKLVDQTASLGLPAAAKQHGHVWVADAAEQLNLGKEFLLPLASAVTQDLDRYGSMVEATHENIAESTGTYQGSV
eukprot:scaffold316489_cov50-Prasinocladus_malaysianus.AAC.3